MIAQVGTQEASATYWASHSTSALSQNDGEPDDTANHESTHRASPTTEFAWTGLSGRLGLSLRYGLSVRE